PVLRPPRGPPPVPYTTLFRSLAAAGAGEASALAAAWMRGEVAIRRPVQQWYRGPLVLPQDPEPVEIDADGEAHPRRGTFLWGTFDGHQYVASAAFSPTGAAARHVAEARGSL